MIVRLLLALLLVFVAAPGTATAAPACHGDPAMAAHTTPARQTHHETPLADHGCVGCAAIGDWLAERVAAPVLAPSVAPIIVPARLALRADGPPTLKPPRLG